MIKKLTTILSVFLLTMVLAMQTSCKKPVEENTDITKYSQINTTTYKNVLKTTSGKYFVFIMGNTCSACEELESVICEYATLVKDKPGGYVPLYLLNVSDTENNGDIIATDGDDSYSNFQGTTNYENIKITDTPGFLVVENGRVTKLISTKVTEEPKSEIKAFIESLK